MSTTGSSGSSAPSHALIHFTLIPANPKDLSSIPAAADAKPVILVAAKALGAHKSDALDASIVQVHKVVALDKPAVNTPEMQKKAFREMLVNRPLKRSQTGEIVLKPANPIDAEKIKFLVAMHENEIIEKMAKKLPPEDQKSGLKFLKREVEKLKSAGKSFVDLLAENEDKEPKGAIQEVLREMFGQNEDSKIDSNALDKFIDEYPSVEKNALGAAVMTQENQSSGIQLALVTSVFKGHVAQLPSPVPTAAVADVKMASAAPTKKAQTSQAERTKTQPLGHKWSVQSAKTLKNERISVFTFPSPFALIASPIRWIANFFIGLANIGVAFAKLGGSDVTWVKFLKAESPEYARIKTNGGVEYYPRSTALRLGYKHMLAMTPLARKGDKPVLDESLIRSPLAKHKLALIKELSSVGIAVDRAKNLNITKKEFEKAGISPNCFDEIEAAYKKDGDAKKAIAEMRSIIDFLRGSYGVKEWVDARKNSLDPSQANKLLLANLERYDNPVPGSIEYNQLTQYFDKHPDLSDQSLIKKNAYDLADRVDVLFNGNVTTDEVGFLEMITGEATIPVVDAALLKSAQKAKPGELTDAQRNANRLNLQANRAKNFLAARANEASPKGRIRGLIKSATRDQQEQLAIIVGKYVSTANQRATYSSEQFLKDVENIFHLGRTLDQSEKIELIKQAPLLQEVRMHKRLDEAEQNLQKQNELKGIFIKYRNGDINRAQFLLQAGQSLNVAMTERPLLEDMSRPLEYAPDFKEGVENKQKLGDAIPIQDQSLNAIEERVFLTRFMSVRTATEQQDIIRNRQEAESFAKAYENYTENHREFLEGLKSVPIEGPDGETGLYQRFAHAMEIVTMGVATVISAGVAHPDILNKAMMVPKPIWKLVEADGKVRYACSPKKPEGGDWEEQSPAETQKLAAKYSGYEIVRDATMRTLAEDVTYNTKMVKEQVRRELIKLEDAIEGFEKQIQSEIDDIEQYHSSAIAAVGAKQKLDNLKLQMEQLKALKAEIEKPDLQKMNLKKFEGVFDDNDNVIAIQLDKLGRLKDIVNQLDTGRKALTHTLEKRQLGIMSPDIAIERVREVRDHIANTLNAIKVRNIAMGGVTFYEREPTSEQVDSLVEGLAELENMEKILKQALINASKGAADGIRYELNKIANYKSDILKALKETAAEREALREIDQKLTELENGEDVSFSKDLAAAFKKAVTRSWLEDDKTGIRNVQALGIEWLYIVPQLTWKRSILHSMQ
jgi:hypothetical protein